MTAPSLAHIQQAVAERFGIPLGEMSSHRRGHAVAHPRQVAMYLARDLTPFSLPAIGRHFGGRDHTTVLHALKVVAWRAAVDVQLASIIAELRAGLLPPDDPNQLTLPLVPAQRAAA